MTQAIDGTAELSADSPWPGVDARAAQVAHAEACANCGTRRIGEFCHVCGQAGHVHRNLMALVHDIAHGVFHFEGKLWRTLPLLAWRPGELTRRYVHGERAKYISPVALFLFSVFLMFAVVSNLAGEGTPTPPPTSAVRTAEHLQQAEARLAKLNQERRTASGAARAAIDRRIEQVQDQADALEVAVDAGAIIRNPTGGPDGSHIVHTNTGWAWFDEAVVHMSTNPALTIYKLKSYAYKYSWALIPISVPFIWLLFAWRRGVGLYDHAIFSIYSLSFMSLGVVTLTVLSLIGLPTPIIVLSAMLIPPIHMYRQLKGAYLLGRWGAAWRTIALLMITSVTSLLFLAFLFYMGSG